MGGVISAITGSAGSNSANKALQQGGNNAIDILKQIYDQTRTDNAPWLQHGQQSSDELGYLLGLGDQSGYQGINSANGNFGSLLQPFSMADYQEDPGYAFRLAQGTKALQNSAAAKGNLLSGAYLKGLDNYSQGLASQEYQNAYNRYNTNQGNVFSRLSGVSQSGQNASSADQSAGQNYGNAASGITMNMANATAANKINQADAWGTGLNSLISSFSGSPTPSGFGQDIMWSGPRQGV